jgi:hypothetical protein
LQRKINEAPVIGDGDTAGWPCQGAHEIDLFEHGSNGGSIGQAWGPDYNKSSMHGVEGGCTPQQNPYTQGVETYRGFNLGDNNYHTYTVELETKKARYYFDGSQYGGEIDITGRTFDQSGLFWLINVAAGGSLGGGFDTNAYGGDNKSIYIDYVRVESMGPAYPAARNGWFNDSGLGGSPRAVKLEAETNDANVGMIAETTTDVGGGQDMGNIDPADNVDWYVNFNAMGGTQQYYIRTRNAVNIGTGAKAQYRVFIDGNQVLTNTVNNTGGWQTWTDSFTATFPVSDGNHWVRFVADSGGQNLNWLEVVQNAAGGGSSCSDMVQNGTETGIDCGGSCAACPSCTNGIKDSFASQNWYETGVDCGGPCAACSGGGSGAGAGSTLQAENNTGQSGTTLVTGTPSYLGSLDTNDYFKFTGVDMTGVKGIHVQVAALNSGAVLGARVDSATGTQLGTMTVAATGGWTTFADQQMNLTVNSTGIHDLYIKVESATGGAGNVDFITLSSTSNGTGQGTAFPAPIANPNFDMALTPTGVVQGWSTFFNNGGTFTSNSSWGRIGLTTGTGVNWHQQVYQTKVGDGGTYTWHCDFKGNEGTTNKTVNLFCEMNGGTYAPYGNVDCTSTGGAWNTTCSVTCSPPAGTSFKFGLRAGQDAVDYDFDTCVLTDNP